MDIELEGGRFSEQEEIESRIADLRKANQTNKDL